MRSMFHLFFLLLTRWGLVLGTVNAYYSTPRSFARSPLLQMEMNPNMNNLNNIKNMRDIATASELNTILKTKLFRTGCVSKADQADCDFLANEIKLKSLIDLRSPTELHKDDNLKTNALYVNTRTFKYNQKKKDFDETMDCDVDECNILQDTGLEPAESVKLHKRKRKRYFVSLMSERLIMKGIFKRFRKRDRFRAAILVPLSKISRRADTQLRKLFIGDVNKGGLKLLNEIIIEQSGYEIISVMKLLSDLDNLPAAVYCTAGKDRTGILSMLVLSVLGATDEEILIDYVHSDGVYSQLGDKAVVMTLEQKEVDPSVFLGAPREVMVHTLEFIRAKYGSINGYLDSFGFDNIWRRRMQNAFLVAG